MLNRFTASLGLALAAFAATTGVSSAAIDTQTEVMYVTGAVIVVFLVLISIAASVKMALGVDGMAPIEPDEAERGIRNSGFGEAAYEAEHGHASHGDHAAGQDDHAADAHGAPAAHGAH